MRSTPTSLAAPAARPAAAKRCRPFLILFATVFLIGGCRRLTPLDTAPLDNAGMSYDAIQQLKSFDITSQEVTQIAEARQAGFPDNDCIQAVQIYHNRGKAFDVGQAVAGLTQVGVGDSTILELARLNQLGVSWGELQAMHLAGLSDAIIVAEARRRADHQPVLSGASLARLKNAGVSESTLLKLTERGVPNSRAGAILAYRRRGASDREILRRYARS